VNLQKIIAGTLKEGKDLLTRCGGLGNAPAVCASTSGRTALNMPLGRDPAKEPVTNESFDMPVDLDYATNDSRTHGSS
jgi:hypothetical protein